MGHATRRRALHEWLARCDRARRPKHIILLPKTLKCVVPGQTTAIVKVELGRPNCSVVCRREAILERAQGAVGCEAHARCAWKLHRSFNSTSAGLSDSGLLAMSIIWTIDSTDCIGGHSARAIGAPCVGTPGQGVGFDGVRDGLIVEDNPLTGLGAFTVEVLFFPTAGGGHEQRFVHMQEHGSENRALIELRSGEGGWFLDTYLHATASHLTLIAPEFLHPIGHWHWAALTYDGVTMRHFVNGTEEASGLVSFAPLQAGRTSIGVRQNLVSWFKGNVREIRVSTRPLLSAQLKRM